MKFTCNVCYKTSRLEFADFGNVPPTECPFKTNPMATASWKLITESRKPGIAK